MTLDGRATHRGGRMYTAEKRALLEAQGEPWPDCECHGEAMGWCRDIRKPADGYFRCRTLKRADNQRLRERAQAEGVCWQCGNPLDTAWLCVDCGEANRDAQWRHNQKPKRRLDKYLENTRSAIDERSAQGFRPTRVGMAAVRAVLEQATGEQ